MVFTCNTSGFHYLWSSHGTRSGRVQAVLASCKGLLGRLGPYWGSVTPTGSFLGPSWGPLGRMWIVLGPSWGRRRQPKGLLGRLGSHRRASWAVMGPSWRPVRPLRGL
eukprot:2049352-Pyramimonas_sp.AAC.1